MPKKKKNICACYEKSTVNYFTYSLLQKLQFLLGSEVDSQAQKMQASLKTGRIVRVLISLPLHPLKFLLLFGNM